MKNEKKINSDRSLRSNKHAEIIETSIFSSLLQQNLLKIEESKSEPVILKDGEVVTKKLPKEKQIVYDFKPGDLITPSNGVANSFFFKRGMNLNPNYTYRKATSAQRIYFQKRVTDQKSKAKNYADVQKMMYDKYGTDD